jgi:hypothetical protein
MVLFDPQGEDPQQPFGVHPIRCAGKIMQRDRGLELIGGLDGHGSRAGMQPDFIDDLDFELLHGVVLEDSQPPHGLGKHRPWVFEPSADILQEGGTDGSVNYPMIAG